MKIIGLLGGIASGKSLVAEQLCQLGAGLLDGDRAGHEVLRLTDVRELVRERWGDGVFGSDREVDRKALGRIVFGPSPEGRRELEYLEAITHPRITERLRQQAADLAAEGMAVAVLDAPVMLKAGWDKFCNHIVFVEAPQEMRHARALARGWRQEDIAARESAQEPLSIKRARADRVIDNSGSREQTRAQVERLWRELVEPSTPDT
ncbi:MAG: dephospho-CoA kinase [Planctomycetia bacterium 21-64-5]|nr:MAG: dephospho-CoA kinase [Planctomycetia bacterium 21-64-5]HQU41730.1 dephospho-CoA kinase [Pirellulales bacterium]